MFEYQNHMQPSPEPHVFFRSKWTLPWVVVSSAWWPLHLQGLDGSNSGPAAVASMLPGAWQMSCWLSVECWSPLEKATKNIWKIDCTWISFVFKINTAIFIVYGFSIFKISPGKLRQKSHPFDSQLGSLTTTIGHWGLVGVTDARKQTYQYILLNSSRMKRHYSVSPRQLGNFFARTHTDLGMLRI